MLHLTKRQLARWMESLLPVPDSPSRTAAAFAVGVAVGFSPFVGLHMVSGLALAFVVNLNRVAVFAGVWINLPWFMGPYYAATTALGAWITGTAMPPRFVFQLESIRNIEGWHARMGALIRLLRPLLLPYTLGSLLVCVPIGLTAYRAT